MAFGQIYKVLEMDPLPSSKPSQKFSWSDKDGEHAFVLYKKVVCSQHAWAPLAKVPFFDAQSGTQFTTDKPTPGKAFATHANVSATSKQPPGKQDRDVPMPILNSGHVTGAQLSFLQF